MHIDLKIISRWSFLIWPCFFILFYIWTMPENYSEAEDVYNYAYSIEQGSLEKQLGVNRLLALPFFSVLYNFIIDLGFEISAFAFVLHLNQLLAVGSLLIFRLILFGQLSLNYNKDDAIRMSWIGVLLLAFSYGFWRYSNVPETYILAIFILCLAWLFVLNNRFLLGAFLSGLGILIHLLNIIPLIIGICSYYLFQKKIKKAFIHGCISTMIIVIGYSLFWKMLDISGLGAKNHSIESGWQIQNLIRGSIAFAQCLISGNFLFGFDWFNNFLTDLFPSRMLSEEQFLGSKMPQWIPWVGIFSFLMVLLSIILAIKPIRILSFSSPFMSALWVWLFTYFLILTQIESGSMELWILALIPFWLIIVFMIHKRWAFALVLSVLIHNGVAGIFPLINKNTDYHYLKSSWILANSNDKDIVFIDYEPILISYLNYTCEANIINSANYKSDELIKMAINCDGNVWAFNSFFNPMPSMQWRNKDVFNRQIKNSEKLKKMFILEHTDVFGGVYKMKDLYYE